MVTKDELTRTVYTFGSVTHGPYGLMTFSPRGRVTTRYNENEYKYELKDGILSFMRADGMVTSRLKPEPSGRAFGPVDGPGHYLRPELELEPASNAHLMPPVFINTLPKAGTFMMAKALENIGYRSADLHVMDAILYDNRNVAMDEVHWDPAPREKPISARSIAAILTRGEFAAGHLTDIHEMQAFENQRVRLINIVREPRSMLLSFFVFTREKVKPTPTNAVWMSMDGLDAFKAFLLSAPIDHWMRSLDTIVENFDFLRYEDLKQGKLKRRPVGTALYTRLGSGLKSALGTKTATFIEGTRDSSHEWFQDPTVQAFLEDRGVAEISRKYWPELNQATKSAR